MNASQEVLQRVVADPLGFLNQALLVGLDRLAQERGLQHVDGEALEAVLVEALGERIAQGLGGRAPDGTNNDSEWTETAPRALPSPVLEDVADALGACKCWGEDARCSRCAGEGAPGWLAPDRDLYDYYIAPAVRRRAAVGVGATHSQLERTSRDDLYVAR